MTVELPVEYQYPAAALDRQVETPRRLQSELRWWDAAQTCNTNEGSRKAGSTWGLSHRVGLLYLKAGDHITHVAS